jgi:hypothetical protein
MKKKEAVLIKISSSACEVKMRRNILITYFLIGIFIMPVELFAASTGIMSTSPITGVTVEEVRNPWNKLNHDPNWMIDFSNTSGQSFACMVGYAFRVDCITKVPGSVPPRETYLKCRVESDYAENGWAVMYYQYINSSVPPWNMPWGYMTSNYHDYSPIKPYRGSKDERDGTYEIVVHPEMGGSVVVVYLGVPEVGMPERGIGPGVYPPNHNSEYNILVSFPGSNYSRNRARFQIGVPHSFNPNDDAYGYNLAKAFYIETTYDSPYVSSLLNVSTSGVYSDPPSSHKPWWWDYLYPTSLSMADTILYDDSQPVPTLINDTPTKSDRGFIQKGFFRVLTQNNTETSLICTANATSDTNEYIRPPLNYSNLPEVDGNTVTVTTNIGDMNIEYQYCLYYDNSSQSDPCSEPNWIIQKVNKVVPIPLVDTSDFSWGDYYVMQWKIKLPLNCQAVDSFTIWQPNYVGLFMKKYADVDGIVYYVSNPLLPTMYQEMAGTYIGTEDIYSLLPQDPLNEDAITIYYNGYYHPYDITQDGIINLEDFAILAKDYHKSSVYDLTGDGIITLEDIGILLNYYLDDSRWESFLTVYPQGDFNHDNKVNFIDFARLGNLWHNGTEAQRSIEDLEKLCDNWLYGTN